MQNEIVIHGHHVGFRLAGEGPLLVLVHGITSNAATWDRVMPALARRFTVLAPDLLGHGLSAKPRGDYSLGAYASGVRDLMTALGHDRATFVGHSLGGGVAMQLAYQFPERAERLVLVSSGGLGREVHPILRAATLPGAEVVLPLLCSSAPRAVVRRLTGALQRVGLRPGEDLLGMAEGIASLADLGARRAFVQTARAILDAGGQRVNATDRLYLAGEIPTLLLWGSGDPMIPVDHAYAAHALIAGSRLEVFHGAGHFPHREEPLAFIDALTAFIDETQPARVDPESWRDLLVGGAAAA